MRFSATVISYCVSCSQPYPTWRTYTPVDFWWWILSFTAIGFTARLIRGSLFRVGVFFSAAFTPVVGATDKILDHVVHASSSHQWMASGSSYLELTGESCRHPIRSWLGSSLHENGRGMINTPPKSWSLNLKIKALKYVALLVFPRKLWWALIRAHNYRNLKLLNRYSFLGKLTDANIYFIILAFIWAIIFGEKSTL